MKIIQCSLLASLLLFAADTAFGQETGVDRQEVAGDGGEFGSPPELDADSLVGIQDNVPDGSDFLLGARPGLEFTPSATALLASNVSASEKGTVTSISSSPFRLINGGRGLWGATISASHDSGTNRTTLGVGYTFRPRWLLASKQSALSERALEVHDCKQKPKTCIADAIRYIETRGVNLYPVPSLSANWSTFAPNTAVTGQQTYAGYQLKGSLDWRYGSWVLASAVGTIGESRANDEAGTPLVGKRTLSLTATTVFPQLLGAGHYDANFLENQYQQGIGLGFTVSHTACTEDEASRANCPDGVLSDLLFGAVIDLRLTSSLAPRFVIGRRTFERVDEVEGNDEAELQLGFQLAFSISNVK